MATGTIKKPYADIVSVTRVAEYVITGATGNIATPYPNDGCTAIIAPHTSGSDYAVRAWVASASGFWFLTVINPNTGATINESPVNIRYWVIKFSHL